MGRVAWGTVVLGTLALSTVVLWAESRTRPDSARLSLVPEVKAERADPSLTREARAVSIGGAAEEWRLVWGETPQRVCEPEDIGAATCPCMGIAYGEYGHLGLQRWQAGNLTEDLPLGPLYGAFDGPGEIPQGMIPLRRKLLDDARDHGRGERAPDELAAEVARRPDAAAMQFADYDHDGVASEFLLNVGTLPCGKLQFVAVGVSRAEPRLHAFGTAAHPDRPLAMPRHAWEALRRDASRQRVVTWDCDDHMSEVHTELEISATAGRISAKNLSFACPFNSEDSQPRASETF